MFPTGRSTAGVFECDCGETLVWMRPATACACGPVHTDVSRDPERRPTDEELHHPWLEEYEEWRGGTPTTCDANTSVSSRWRAVTSGYEASGEAASRERSLRYLIARHENNRLELLTLAATSRGEALPVFGTERAARDFLRSGGFGGGWLVRESTAGELVSLLLGHLADVDGVALDPSPGLSAPDAGLPSTSKKEFIDALMG